MAVEEVITELRQYLQSISHGSVLAFENGFVDVHARWHFGLFGRGARRFNNLPIGFLCFHHEALNIRNEVIKRNGGTPPQPWRGLNDPPGMPAGPDPPYPGRQRLPPLNSITDPATFSISLEDWHNEVHNNTREYGKNFADPSKNIFMPLFWCWHAFIEKTFLDWLIQNNMNYEGDVDKTRI
jgi:hypothetical protein